ncbi:MAG: InlB B-repeat-containing protein, partial [Cyclonatronaceae bacterium]
MKKYLFTVVVVVSVVMFSCDTVETSFDEALPERYTLITSVFPTGAGEVVPSEGLFVAGSSVAIEAVPNPGYVFRNWEGDLAGNTNPRSILFTRDRNVIAHFLFRDYPLNVEIVGEGTVEEEVISQTEQKQAEQGTDTQTPVHGGISGIQDNVVTPVLPDNDLLLSPDRRIISDADSVSDQNSISETVQATTVTVRLTAQPASGWIFDRWENDLSGSANPETIVVDEEKNVTAVFVQADSDMYTLSVQVDGEGSVSVDPEKEQYESGEEVTLTATAALGWRFTGWQGDLSGNTNPATLVMNSDKSVTANFRRIG